MPSASYTDEPYWTVYLTTLIGALQAVTGVVLGAYFNKSKAENTKGGIVYDAAMSVPYSDTDL